MKFVSWNVNGLRAVMKKGFMDFFEKVDADVFCLQEIKLQEGQIEMELPGYFKYWNYALKKGYSGTAIFTKREPITVRYGLGVEEHDAEGRIITLEFDNYFVVTVYTPNSQHGLLRLDYRLRWEDALLTYIKNLDQQKPVILCGDLNVAHEEIDLRNPKANMKNSGFTPEERGKLSSFLESGFIDTFRYFYPGATGRYSWWSYRSDCRAKNIGWRIDYFIASLSLVPNLKGAKIHAEVLGSDHCPIELEMAF
ncbi:exodeoxyribonuclease III [Planomicrobium sp. CPCC 101079]|uniref:exodeoxyribonuclease III n=1 Tax=Planomicrobium sp. CPCC 101079 TaxID=2599618 RepID=UPI0011B4F697|nr:exodeoxyribonuclease III [Planomicrobium sp. CPCC 101079]TWT06182.1 exodeoxyribonuclease III [Planomicrobium sp. CPCC 101079]